MNDTQLIATESNRIQVCSEVFRRIRDASENAGAPMLRIVTDRVVDERPFEELKTQKFRIGVGEDLTELPLLDMLFVVEMVQHDQRNRNIPEGHRRTVVSLDDISETAARKILSDLQQSPGIEVRRS